MLPAAARFRRARRLDRRALIALVVPIAIALVVAFQLGIHLITFAGVARAELSYRFDDGAACVSLAGRRSRSVQDLPALDLWTVSPPDRRAAFDVPIATDIVQFEHAFAIGPRSADIGQLDLALAAAWPPAIVALRLRLDLYDAHDRPVEQVETMPIQSVDAAPLAVLIRTPAAATGAIASLSVQVDRATPIDRLIADLTTLIKGVTMKHFALPDRRLDRVKISAKPMLFGGRDHDATIGVQWETNCNVVPAAIVVDQRTDRSVVVRTIQVSPSTFVHRAQPRLPIDRPFSYFVSSGDERSDVFTTTLAAMSRGSFQIAFVSDSQSSAQRFRRVLTAIMTDGDRRPDLLVHVGDFVQDASRRIEYRTYWTAPLETGALGQTTRLALTRGNHDAEHPLSYTYTYGPGNNAWSVQTYAEERGGIRLFLLDSNHGPTTPIGQVQTEWLTRELQSTATRAAAFVVVVVHAAPFVEYWDPNVYDELRQWQFVRDVWMPLLVAAEVDLVVSGHSHVYQRGLWRGVHVAVVGGGGGDLDRERAFEWGIYQRTAHQPHYATIELDEDRRLQWRCRSDRPDRAPIDSLSLDRRPSTISSP